MGRSLSWVVVESGDADAIARALGVKRTAETGRSQAFAVSARRLAGNRFLVVSRTVFAGALSRRRRAALSRIAPLVFVEIVETVTASVVEKWSAGTKQWSVDHGGDKSVLDLQTTGKLPADFAALKQATFTRQEQATRDDEGVDYVFDLPLDYAAAQSGVTYDEDIEGESRNDFEHWTLGAMGRKLHASMGLRIVLFILGFFGFLYLLGALKRWVWAQMGWG